MNKGIYIKELRITGPGKKAASLVFEKGLNVIDGPSNTGKSFAFSCIDYMLGKAALSEIIDEAKGYEDIFLEIREHDGKAYTLKRNMKGGHYFIAEATIDNYDKHKKRKLKQKHSTGKIDNLSNFLLSLLTLNDKIVKKNDRNTTRSLSFRDIAKTTMIDEERIFKKASPIYGGQHSDIPVEKSVFNTLLTGSDASALIEVEDQKVRKGKITAQIDLVEELIQQMSGQMPNNDAELLSNRNKYLSKTISDLLYVINDNAARIEQLNKEKGNAWDLLQKKESRYLFLSELLKRFDLLKENYLNDINRLSFIKEGNDLLGQLSAGGCPICGQEITSGHNHTIGLEEADERVVESTLSESRKISEKLSDLTETIGRMEKEADGIHNDILSLKKQVAEIDLVIKKEFGPVVINTKEEVIKMLDEQKSIVRQLAVTDQITGLYTQKSNLLQKHQLKATAVDSSTRAPYGTYKLFCEAVTLLLNNWKYGVVQSAEFDEKKFDIVIDGRSRASNGKGYRSISNAAFIIGLMKFCINKELPHSRMIILDSPLTAYKKSDDLKEEDNLTADIEMAFFYDLSATSKDQQIIIFDNKEPLQAVKEKINYIHFTKQASFGTYGFFPYEPPQKKVSAQ